MYNLDLEAWVNKTLYYIPINVLPNIQTVPSHEIHTHGLLFPYQVSVILPISISDRGRSPLISLFIFDGFHWFHNAGR